MNLEWSQRARDDIENIIAYIEQENPVAAHDLASNILDAVEQNLPDNPLMGRLGRVDGTRELIVHANYLVAYRVAETIQILSVVHAAKLWPKTF